MESPTSRRGSAHLQALRTAKSSPKLGFFALAGSALTVFLSLAMLLAIQGRQVWSNSGIFKIVQPASCLSALLSLNAILVQIALQEGLNVAWFFHAAKPNVTIAKLQEIYSIGTSSTEAFRKWRHFNYISLAAVFVAVVPVNNFVLQSTLTTRIAQVTTNHSLQVPSVRHFDVGFSAIGAPHGARWGNWNPGYWGEVWRQTMSASWNPLGNYAFFGSRSYREDKLFDLGYNSLGSYSARVPGVGFDMSCESYQAFANLSGPVEDGSSYTIFSFWAWFYENHPNEITFNSYWKSSFDCDGDFWVQTCTLKAATVEYPVNFGMHVEGSPYLGPFYTLAPGTTRADDRVLEYLPVADKEGVINSTFGGIASSFDTLYSYYTLVAMNSTEYNAVNASGPLNTFLVPTLEGENPDKFCKLSYQYSFDELATSKALAKTPINPEIARGSYIEIPPDEVGIVNPAELVFERLRQAMFLSSVYTGAQALTLREFRQGLDGIPHNRSYYMQDVIATQTIPVAKYHVRWYLWAISLALTWTTCGFVVPLFWGYWHLDRRYKLGPVDIARVFKAPVISAEPYHLETNALLKRFGTKRIHHDLQSPTEGLTEGQAMLQNKKSLMPMVSEVEEDGH